CATLGFQVLQVVVLSLQLFPEAAFLVVSLSMLGLGSGGSLATALVRRRTFVSPLGPLWGCAIGFSIAVLGAMVATSRMHGQLVARGPAGGTLDRQQWNDLGRLDAIIPGPAIAEFEFARQAKELMDAGCDFRLLFSNGYNWTYTVDFKGQEPERQSGFGRWVQN